MVKFAFETINVPDKAEPPLPNCNAAIVEVVNVVGV
jgi:hypothetical protein